MIWIWIKAVLYAMTAVLLIVGLAVTFKMNALLNELDKELQERRKANDDN